MRNPFVDDYGVTPLGMGATIVGVFALIIGVSVALAVWLTSSTCYGTIDRLGLEGDWGVWSGCVVEVDGRPIPLSNYFVNEEVNE